MTGLGQEKFKALAKAFGETQAAERTRAYEQGKRQRKPGGGQKGKLTSAEEKLLFILVYLKTYPTFDVLGAQFDLARSKACANVHRLTPVLYQTLARLEVVPAREVADIATFKAALSGLDTLLIDATERLRQRPGDKEAQRAYYSGKKNVIPSRTR